MSLLSYFQGPPPLSLLISSGEARPIYRPLQSPSCLRRLYPSPLLITPYPPWRLSTVPTCAYCFVSAATFSRVPYPLVPETDSRTS